MTKVTRLLMAAGVVAGGSAGMHAHAQDASNEVGDADARGDQSGSAASGDGVAGMVVGVVSSGDTSVDATNRSVGVEVTTGDATAANEATVTALQTNDAEANGGLGGDAQNVVGDATASVAQSANAASGDGVAGMVVGVVTSAGGSADLVLSNSSEDAEVTTGDAAFNNNADVLAELSSELVVKV